MLLINKKFHQLRIEQLLQSTEMAKYETLFTNIQKLNLSFSYGSDARKYTGDGRYVSALPALHALFRCDTKIKLGTKMTALKILEQFDVDFI